MNLFASSKSTHKKGQSFVEMAMVMPVILMLVLGGVEYTNLYVQSLRAAAIAREAANMAFRECRGLEINHMQGCLDSVLAEVGKSLPYLLPKFNDTHTIHVDSTGSGCNYTPAYDYQKKNGTLILTAWQTGTRTAAADIADNAVIPSTYTGLSEPLDTYANPVLMAQSKIGDPNTLSKVPPADKGFYVYFSDGTSTAAPVANAFFYQKGGYMFVAEIFYYYSPISGFIKTLKIGGNSTNVLPDEIYQAGFF